jgi:hypothetical protein
MGSRRTPDKQYGMKETEMANQEHIVAVVDPTVDEDTTLDLAQEVVDRGGRATVVVLTGRKTIAGLNEFAHSEELNLPDARAVFLDRLAMQYQRRFNGHTTPTKFATAGDSRFVFAEAARDAATVVALPQRLTRRLGWRHSVSKSKVPVLIAPRRAA